MITEHELNTSWYFRGTRHFGDFVWFFYQNKWLDRIDILKLKYLKNLKFGRTLDFLYEFLKKKKKHNF